MSNATAIDTSEQAEKQAMSAVLNAKTAQERREAVQRLDAIIAAIEQPYRKEAHRGNQ